MSAWHCFECGIISWCAFPGSYYPLSFTKADSCLSLTTGCPQRKWTSALGISGQKGSEGLWEWWCVLGRRSYVEKEQVKGRDWRGIWRKVRAKKNFWKWSRGDLTTTSNSPQCLWEKKKKKQFNALRNQSIWVTQKDWAAQEISVLWFWKTDVAERGVSILNFGDRQSDRRWAQKWVCLKKTLTVVLFIVK